VKWCEEAVFLVSGFVLAQLQAAAGMRLRQSLAKNQKSSLRMATLFLKALQGIYDLRFAIYEGKLKSNIVGRIVRSVRDKGF
jgi:hypothetical protein